jgi:2-polyprenyl-6-hydroxyphenyl methylase/3-demethylubiquinone-9 3-methyltransferase
MDDFTSADFRDLIYNDEYLKVDVDFSEKRPLASAALIERMFGHARPFISLLDFGGGTGLMAKTLTQKGWRCVCFDPVFHDIRPTAESFDIVSCFEVVEHSPHPHDVFRELAGFRKPGGIVLFSTLLQPKDIDNIRLSWWYANPRNGHISLYSRGSLEILLRENGLQLKSISDGLHVGYDSIPEFARRLFQA